MDFYDEAYEKCQSEFGEEQLGFLHVIAESRGMSVNPIREAKGIFLPNNEFMSLLFGNSIADLDCYRGNQCIWENALIFPIRDVIGVTVGFVGFFPFSYAENESNYYAYTSQKVINKGRYLFFPQGSFTKSLDDGYVFLVDGVFDAISLCGEGFNACSLMGSSLTPEVVMQLRFMKKVILVADNDSTGYKLYSMLKKQLSNISIFKQGFTKDIDDALKSEHKYKIVEDLKSAIL